MSTRHIHIAVLDADVPVPNVYAARGLYSSQFRVLLQAAAARVSGRSGKQVKIHVSAYDVIGGTYPALGMLRKTPTTTTTTTTTAEDEGEDEDEDVFRPIDAILITGAAAAAYDKGEQFKWITQLQAFIHRVWTRYPAVKWFGSCFGHQIIAEALLADHHHGSDGLDSFDKVQRKPCPRVVVERCWMGHEVGIYPITLDPTFAANTALGRTFERGLKEKGGDGKLRVQLIHGDRVIGLDPTVDTTTTTATTAREIAGEDASTLSRLPAPWLNIGKSMYSPIQGLYYPGRVLTYQGHFEFDAFTNTETALEFGKRLGWNEETISEALKRIHEPGPDDSELAAEVVVQFLADDHVEHEYAVDQVNGTDVKIEHPERRMVAQSAVQNGLITPPDEVSMSI